MSWRLIFRPSTKPSSSTSLLVEGGRGKALLAQMPELGLCIMKPAPAVPRLPLEAPSKFNLYQDLGGGDHLQDFLNLLF